MTDSTDDERARDAANDQDADAAPESPASEPAAQGENALQPPAADAQPTAPLPPAVDGQAPLPPAADAQPTAPFPPAPVPNPAAPAPAPAPAAAGAAPAPAAPLPPQGGGSAPPSGGSGVSIPAPLAAREPWVAGGIHAALALGGAVVASAIVTLCSFLGLGLLLDDPAAMDAVSPHWFPFLIQSLGMGFGGAIGASGGIMGVSYTFSILLIPLLVPIGAVLAVTLLGRRLAPAVALDARWRLVVAAAAGIAFAAVVAIVQAIVPLAIVVPDVQSEIALRAVSVWSVVLGIVVVGAASFLALSPRGLVSARLRAAVVQAVEHLGILGAVLAIATYIAALVDTNDGGAASGLLLLAPLLLPLLALAGSGVATVGSIVPSLRGDFSEIGLGFLTSGLDEALADVPNLWMFSSTFPVWVRVTLPIVVLLALVVASVRWRARRGAQDDVVSWISLPLAYGAFGVVATAVGRLAVSADLGATGDVAQFLGDAGVSMGASVGLAAWSFLLFAVFGIVVEVLARFVVPIAAQTAPPAALRALAFGIAPAAQAAPAAGSAPLPPGYAAPDGSAPAAQPDPLAAAFGAGAGEDRPANPRAKRAWIIGTVSVAGVLVLVVAAVVVRGVLADTRYSPQAQVEQYLQHIVDGEAEAAIELWGPNVTSGERVLLTDAVYGAAEDRPTSFEIVDSSTSGEGASVSATLEVDGKDYEAHFSLEKSGTQAVFFDDWRITDGPVQDVALGDVSQSPAVNGAEVDLSAHAPTSTSGFVDPVVLPVLPGTYTFQAPEGDGVLTYGDDVSVTVLPGQSGSDGSEELPAFEATWTDEAQQQAIDLVQERIDLCMTSDRFQPSDCSNSLGIYEPSYAVTGITRSWEEEPTLTFVDDESTEGPIVRVEGGVMLVDYQYRFDDEDDWEDEQDRESSPFGGGWFSSSTDVPASVDDSGEVTVDLSEF